MGHEKREPQPKIRMGSNNCRRLSTLWATKKENRSLKNAWTTKIVVASAHYGPRKKEPQPKNTWTAKIFAAQNDIWASKYKSVAQTEMATN